MPGLGRRRPELAGSGKVALSDRVVEADTRSLIASGRLSTQACRPQPLIECSFTSQRASAKRGGFSLAKVIERTHLGLRADDNWLRQANPEKGRNRFQGVWKHAST
jgi:hypothetical protein